MINKEIGFSGQITISDNKNNRSLYKHQKEAIKALNDTKKYDIYKGLLVIPTGGGKTFTSIYWVMNQMINEGKKVLWIAHRHELLNQTMETIAYKASNKNIIPNRESFRYRIISGMHDRPVNISINDDFIIASKDSLNRGLKYLEKWVEANKNDICIIVDEAHHAIAKTYRSIINLVEKHSVNWLRLVGLTATPTTTSINEKGLLRKVFTNDICYSVDLNILVAEGILSKPIFLDSNTFFKMKRELTINELNLINRSGNLPDEIAKEITLNKERNNLIVTEYTKNKSKYGKTLVFAINIDHAIALNALFKERGIRSDFVVSSLRDINTGVQISNKENAIKLKAFKEEKLDVLINVNILTEGTDIPNVQTVFLTRQTTSSILLNQMIGRGLRGVKAGGTDKAYIISFIDEWKYKINWISPRSLPEYGEFIDGGSITRKYQQNLIDIRLIENFAKLMDKTVVTSEYNYYNEYEALGAYMFAIFNENDDEERDCQVIVFKHLKTAYEEFIDNIDKVIDKSSDYTEPSENPIDSLVLKAKNKYFEGFDLTIGFNEEDIKDILLYYSLTNEIPEYVQLENSKGIFKPRKEEDYSPEIIVDWEYEKLSMSQLREIDVKYWRTLREAVFDKFKDEDGYYVSATKEYRSISRRYFQIDHKIPMKEGGKTTLDNLQLLTRWENWDKKDKMPIEYLEERLGYSYENEDRNDKAYEIIKEIMEENPENICALTTLGWIKLDEEKYRAALMKANKVLSLDKDNVDALLIKGYSYFRRQNYGEAILALERSVRFHENGCALYIIGKCYYNIKKKEIALAYYHKAFDLYEDQDNLKSEISFDLGQIYFSKRKYEMALTYYDIAFKLNGEFCNAINNKGVCLERLGKLQEALLCYKKANEINSKEKTYINNINKAINKLSNNKVESNKL